MSRVLCGLDQLRESKKAQKSVLGSIAYLCHSASVTAGLESGVQVMQEIFGDRLRALMTPQYGMFGDQQANMAESADFVHPHYRLPVFSLYSKTRVPTGRMLEGIDTVVVDLQDIGGRVCTYIHTLTLLMETCAERKIRVVVLDRPNPIGGVEIEGNVLDLNFASFVGRHPIPMRHGLTIGEAAKLADYYFSSECELRVIRMKGWKREMYFEATGLPWVLPSPNIPTLDSALAYPGAVLFEGTTLSEGRGTTRPFEIIGYPGLEPYALIQDLHTALTRSNLAGVVLRPVSFIPAFDKHQGVLCDGFQIHVIDRSLYRPWTTAQIILRELHRKLGGESFWRPPPYEYEENILPIDILNGTDALRQWVERRGTKEQLSAIEDNGRMEYREKRESVLMY